MSIAEAVRAVAKPTALCKFGAILASLGAEDAAAINDTLADGSLTATEAARILSRNGHPVSATATKSHVRRDCCCKDPA